MKLSRYLIPTLKEDPTEAVVTSHKLMLRAGLIKKESSGMYAYLPLGFLLLNKVTNIIREEMNKSGALEFLMPELTNADLWKESGRWEEMGPEMIRIKDRNGLEYALAPTHEEAFTSLVRSLISSYRDLPLNVYQINTKFRDEIRPRYGIIRSKEFIMKDAYSFDIDEAGLEKTYQLMRQTYRNIFVRCGLETIPVEADSGAMGGSASEEFMVASEVGEENLLICPSCDYKANQEKAEFQRNDLKINDKLEQLELVSTPEVKSIEDLVTFFKVKPGKFLKSIIYIADEDPVMVVVPGDREVNEHKLKNILQVNELLLAEDEAIEKITGAPVGFAGPVGDLSIKIWYDLDIKKITNAFTGGNKKDYHYKGVNPGRDFEIKNEADLTLAKDGDLCPKCQAKMMIKKGIEVGHIFKLGDKYTSKMQVTVLNENGKAIIPLMGCYGIGVNRTLAAIVEQHHDDQGIVWPEEMAPWPIHLLCLGKKEEEKKASEQLYDKLQENGWGVLYDDRKLSPGFKFAEADLIGLPFRITLGKKFFQDGEVELKFRKTSEVKIIPEKELINFLKEIIA